MVITSLIWGCHHTTIDQIVTILTKQRVIISEGMFELPYEVAQVSIRRAVLATMGRKLDRTLDFLAPENECRIGGKWQTTLHLTFNRRLGEFYPPFQFPTRWDHASLIAGLCNMFMEVNSIFNQITVAHSYLICCVVVHTTQIPGRNWVATQSRWSGKPDRSRWGPGRHSPRATCGGRFPWHLLWSSKPFQRRSSLPLVNIYRIGAPRYHTKH